MMTSCPNDCSGRGTCCEGTCDCAIGWSGESCDISTAPNNNNDTSSNGNSTAAANNNVDGESVLFGLSLGPVIGIAVGACCCLVLLIGGIVFLVMRRKNDDYDAGTSVPMQSYTPPDPVAPTATFNTSDFAAPVLDASSTIDYGSTTDYSAPAGGTMVPPPPPTNTY
mmetsp:Transcript_7164/g.12586  ORF Transcript_7164/g.12586 Transcript_7164/m.12586 type:complete len:167 (+) Transcript_7164:3-503(+)